MRKTVVCAVALATSAAVGACSGAGSTGTANGAAAAGPASGRPAAAAHQVVPTPPKVPGITWRRSGSLVHGRAATYLATTRAGSVGLLWMDPTLLTFRYLPGLQFPEQGPVLPADRRPATWVPTLAAAFNGAFKLRDHVGGYYYAGRTVTPLRAGLAAIVIDSTGRLHVVRWGREVATVSGLRLVRENMRLLVDGSVAQTRPTDTTSTWGWADHNTPLANRSALGQLPDGSLVYAYGHQVTAADMAAALVEVGASTAIMLDMNITQPGGFVYAHTPAGVVGQRVLPAVIHAPSVYERPWVKDFFVALARP